MERERGWESESEEVSERGRRMKSHAKNETRAPQLVFAM